MRTTINIPDDIIKETEAIYKAGSRSKSIEQALRDALQQKKLEQLKEMIGKIEFDEEVIYESREKER
jgi:metal-responsive CopG/Arc/MetJ family transcriptional regulator